MHSRSNLYHSNVSSTYYVSSLISDGKKSIRYSRLRICNVLEKSTFSNLENYPAPVGFFAGAGFLPDLEKVPDTNQSGSPEQC